MKLLSELPADVVEPVPPEPGQDATDSDEHRHGTRAVFLFVAPLRGWRRVNSYQHRTRRAWAQEVRSLLAIDYPDARQVKLLADNLNPHHLALLGEAFAAEVAHRFEIPYTPRHGSC